MRGEEGLGLRCRPALDSADRGLLFSRSRLAASRRGPVWGGPRMTSNYVRATTGLLRAPWPFPPTAIRGASCQCHPRPAGQSTHGHAQDLLDDLSSTVANLLRIEM